MLYRIAMRNIDTALESYLNELALQAQVGDRLPTVRDLMARFQLSQPVVQRVFHRLRERGVIDIQPGRGMFFLLSGNQVALALGGTSSPNHASAMRSILLLRRSVNVDRGRLYVDMLSRRFAADGHRVIEVSFTDPAHAKTVLQGLPRFDVCVIQSVFHMIPNDMLTTIHDKAQVVAFDGVAMVGHGLDSVGTEWGEPLASAVRMLHAKGHRRVCFAATGQPFLATQLGFRRWEGLRSNMPDMELSTIKVPRFSDDGYLDALLAEIGQQVNSESALPYTAMVVWGVHDGALFLQRLQAMGLRVPLDVSVVLLGRTDLPNEHADFFETYGAQVQDQVNLMYDTIVKRLQEPQQPFGVYFAPVTHREGKSVQSL